MGASVEDIQQRISSREYAEWQAYAAIVGPLGPEREEQQLDRLEHYLAQIAWMLAEVNRDRKKRAQAYKLDDFILYKRVGANEVGDEADENDEAARAAALERKILAAFGSWIKAD